MLPHSAGYARRSGTFNVLFNYCIHSRGEYNKDIGAMLLLLCGGRILRGGLSMTEVYTKCTASSICSRECYISKFSYVFDRCKEYVIPYLLYSHLYMSPVVELYGTELSKVESCF